MTPPALTLQHERVDDIPLLVGVLEQLRLPEILQRHLGSHPLHQGLANGTLAATWMAFILSEANHCKASVEDWAHRHQRTLETLLHQPLRSQEFSDDRLGIVLRRLHAADWAALEKDLWQATCEVYELPLEGVRLDSPTSYGYHQVNAEGLMQLGHSKDHRPDLPPVKLMAAAAQPTAQILACDVVPGNAADDPLYVPLITRVRSQLQRKGLLYLGDCKMAALITRADLVVHGDYYLTVLPRTPDNAECIATWLGEMEAGQHVLHDLSRTKDKGEQEFFARGCEFMRTCQAERHGQLVEWSERVQLVQTEALAQYHREQLEKRLREAEADVRGLTPAVGRGQQQYRAEKELRVAVQQVLERHKVDGLIEVAWSREKYSTKGSVQSKVRYPITEVSRDAAKIAAAKQRYGWRVQVTNLSKKQSGLLESVLLYNGGWSMERDWHLLKDKPLGIQPLYVRDEEQVDGLTKLLLITLRVLTFIEIVVRGGLAQANESLKGLYEGQPNRKTSKPTGQRLLRAISRLGITLTQVTSGSDASWWLTPLPPLLERILELLSLPRQLYAMLASDTG